MTRFRRRRPGPTRRARLGWVRRGGALVVATVRLVTTLLLLASALLVVALVAAGAAGALSLAAPLAVPGRSGMADALSPPTVAVGHASLDRRPGPDGPVDRYEQAVANASLTLMKEDPQVAARPPGTSLPGVPVGAGAVVMSAATGAPQVPPRPGADVRPHWEHARPGGSIAVAAKAEGDGPGDAGRRVRGPASESVPPARVDVSAPVQAGRGGSLTTVVPAGISIESPKERPDRTLPGGHRKSITGEITLEDGTRVLRTGEVIWPDGTRVGVDGTRVRVDGTKVPARTGDPIQGPPVLAEGDRLVHPDGSVESGGAIEGADNSRRLSSGTKVLAGGWVLSPDGSVTDRYGNHYGQDGTTTYDDHRITQYANGSLRYPNGIVESSQRVLFFPDGTIKFPWPNGLVIYPDETTQQPTWRLYDGGLQYAGGWVEYEDRVVNPMGETQWRDGRISDRYGITTYPGGIIRFRDGVTEYPDHVEFPYDSGPRPVDYEPVHAPLNFIPPKPGPPLDLDGEARDRLIEVRAQPEPEPEPAPGQPRPQQSAPAVPPAAPAAQQVVTSDPPPAVPPPGDQGSQRASAPVVTPPPPAAPPEDPPTQAPTRSTVAALPESPVTTGLDAPLAGSSDLGAGGRTDPQTPGSLAASEGLGASAGGGSGIGGTGLSGSDLGGSDLGGSGNGFGGSTVLSGDFGESGLDGGASGSDFGGSSLWSGTDFGGGFGADGGGPVG